MELNCQFFSKGPEYLPVLLFVLKKIKKLKLATLWGQTNLWYDEVKTCFISGQTKTKNGQTLGYNYLRRLAEKVLESQSQLGNDG